MITSWLQHGYTISVTKKSRVVSRIIVNIPRIIQSKSSSRFMISSTTGIAKWFKASDEDAFLLKKA